MSQVQFPNEHDVIFEAVECNNCHRVHRKDSESYIKITGNVYVGHGGGILGGDWSKGVPVHIFCRENKGLCMTSYLKEAFV